MYIPNETIKECINLIEENRSKIINIIETNRYSNSYALERLYVNITAEAHQKNMVKQQTKDYNEGFVNEVLDKKHRGIKTIEDFIAAYNITLIKGVFPISVRDMQNRRILDKHPLAISLEFNNFPVFIGTLFSGKVFFFEEVEEDFFIKLNNKVNEYLDKDIVGDNYITEVLYSEDTSFLDRLSFVISIAISKFKFENTNVEDMVDIIFSIALLGYVFNSNLEITLSEDLIKNSYKTLVNFFFSNDLLIPIGTELKLHEPYMWNEYITEI